MVNVLVVENHAAFRRWLQDVVRTRFPTARVLAIDNGSAALAAADTFRPDVVIMDLRLPGLNGLEIARALRARASRAAVIMLTGCDLPEYRAAAYEAGARRFLTKSEVNEQRIVELIAAAAARTTRLSHDRPPALPAPPDVQERPARAGLGKKHHQHAPSEARPLHD